MSQSSLYPYDYKQLRLLFGLVGNKLVPAPTPTQLDETEQEEQQQPLPNYSSFTLTSRNEGFSERNNGPEPISMQIPIEYTQKKKKKKKKKGLLYSNSSASTSQNEGFSQSDIIPIPATLTPTQLGGMHKRAYNEPNFRSFASTSQNEESSRGYNEPTLTPIQFNETQKKKKKKKRLLYFDSSASTSQNEEPSQLNISPISTLTPTQLEGTQKKKIKERLSNSSPSASTSRNKVSSKPSPKTIKPSNPDQDNENLTKKQQQQNDDHALSIDGLLERGLDNQSLLVKVEEEPFAGRRLVVSFNCVADGTFVPLIIGKTRFRLGIKVKDHSDRQKSSGISGDPRRIIIVLWASVSEYTKVTSSDVFQVIRKFPSFMLHEEIIRNFYFSWRPFFTSLLRDAYELNEEALTWVLTKTLPREETCLRKNKGRHQLRFQELIAMFCSSDSTFLERLQHDNFLIDREHVLLVKRLIESIVQITKSLKSVRHLLGKYYSTDSKGLLRLIEKSFDKFDTSMQPLHTQNFRKLPLIPVLEELRGVINSLVSGFSKDSKVQSLLTLESHLTPNCVDGPWDSPEEFLNVHFRLLREECFASIRDLIASVRLDPRDQLVHREVQVIGYAVDAGTIVIRMKYKPHKSRNNLMFGNLVCIDVDTTFSKPIWATVKSSEVKTTELSITLVGVGNNYVAGGLNDADDMPTAEVLVSAIQRLINCRSGVMVESPTYYHAFRPVLARLQSLSESDFPFASEILLKSTKPQLSPMKFSLVPENIEMDESQILAAKASFKYRFSLIQGPPGCGKTFVGKEIVKAMLKSKSCNGPILLMTYKNHALDSFLEGCLDFTESVVRIGGRSTSEKIAAFNLHDLKKETNFHNSKEELRVLNNARGQLRRFAQQVEKAAEISLVDITASELLSFLLNRGITGMQQVRSLLEYNFEQNYGRLIKQKVKYSPEEVRLAVNDILESHPDTAAKLLKDSLNQWLPESELAEFLPKPQRSFFIKTPLVKKTNEVDDEEIEGMPLEEEDWERIVSERVIGSESKLKFKDIFQKGEGLYRFLQKRMADLEPNERESQVCELTDIWSITPEGRFVLLSFWFRKWRMDKDEHLSKSLEQYNRYYHQVQELEDASNVAFLKTRDLVACTITGCCLRIGLISQLEPSVVIVEEAAEILESQLVASLPSSVKHVVFIGDHKQLPPQVRHYRLAKEFKLGVSIFERLANNGYPVNQLQFHRRGPRSLCPLFSWFYQQEIIAENPNPRPPSVLSCMGLMYWWQHSVSHRTSPNGVSLENEFEAAMIVGTVRLLIMLGEIEASRISIITGYSGQVRKIKEQLYKDDIIGVTVCTIDRFQGEENDFIFLSLTRSGCEKMHDSQRSLGFLASKNRTCVALSRARIGLYIFGCCTLFESHPTWKKVVEHFRSKGKIGRKLPFNIFKSNISFEHPNDFAMLFEKLEAQSQEHKIKLLNQFVKELPRIQEGIHDVTAKFGSKIEKLMNESVLNVSGERLVRFKVNKVKQIFNKEMYLLYLHHQEKIEKSKPPLLDFSVRSKADWMIPMVKNKTNEVFLFHGTSPNLVDTIATDGFDDRVAKEDGKYGIGIYFAESADESDRYAKWCGDRKYMFLARVTLGRPIVTKNTGNWRRPPPIDQEIPNKLYDSVIAISYRKRASGAGSYEHKEFVLFDRYRCLPEFVIEYGIQNGDIK